MNSMELLELIFAVIYAAIPVTALFFREDPEKDKVKYFPLVDPFLLPDLVLVLLLFLLLRGETLPNVLRVMGGRMLAVLTLLTLYYTFMAVLFPLLRRRIRAAVIAVLWILPAELCYMDFLNQNNARLFPRYLIPLGNINVRLLVQIWLGGFASVLLIAIVRHLIFRRQILKDAKPADEDVQKLWTQLQLELGLDNPRRHYRLVLSDAASAPLSIGIYRWSMRVVLPNRLYTAEELQLILRHELIHILHADSRTKFFMTYCTALCWFNPLMWLSMRKCSDDMELSCDEMVLADRGEDIRKRYANLILSVAGDDRGFTTCLSARAESLKYRLQSILHPEKKHRGYLTVFLLFFVFMFGLSGLGFGFGRGSLKELDKDGYYQPEYIESDLVVLLEEDAPGLPPSCSCEDTDALERYIAGLTVTRLDGRRYYTEGDNVIFIMAVPQPDGSTERYTMNLSEQYISLAAFRDSLYASYYYVPGGVDLEYVKSLLTVKK